MLFHTKLDPKDFFVFAIMSFIWANLGLFFVHFCSFQTQFFTEKTVDVCGIRTRIVRVKGKLADHLTTTTAAANLALLMLKLHSELSPRWFYMYNRAVNKFKPDHRLLIGMTYQFLQN